MTAAAPSSSKRSAPTVELFPFLAVLVCAMGALILVLMILTRQARTQHAREALAKMAQQRVAIKASKQSVTRKVQRLKQTQQAAATQLDEARLKLGHVEDHFQALQEQLAGMRRAWKDLDQFAKNGTRNRDLQEAELARLNEEIARLLKEIGNARNKAQPQKHSFAIVPYEGPYGTHRRPIYVECCADAIILQPEGVILPSSDFQEPMGPDNTLATGLRAIREYWARHAVAGPVKSGEPYPLLLVRPAGIKAYYAAREAMAGWGAEFGYELVGEDWDLKYPPPDRALADVLSQQVAIARVRDQSVRQQLIAAAPQNVGHARKQRYHVAPGGGIIADGGDDDDDEPHGSPGGSSNGGSFGESGGGFGSGGGTGGTGGTGGGSGGSYASGGANGGSGGSASPGGVYGSGSGTGGPGGPGGGGAAGAPGNVYSGLSGGAPAGSTSQGPSGASYAMASTGGGGFGGGPGGSNTGGGAFGGGPGGSNTGGGPGGSNTGGVGFGGGGPGGSSPGGPSGSSPGGGGFGGVGGPGGSSPGGGGFGSGGGPGGSNPGGGSDGSNPGSGQLGTAPGGGMNANPAGGYASVSPNGYVANQSNGLGGGPGNGPAGAGPGASGGGANPNGGLANGQATGPGGSPVSGPQGTAAAQPDGSYSTLDAMNARMRDTSPPPPSSSSRTPSNGEGEVVAAPHIGQWEPTPAPPPKDDRDDKLKDQHKPSDAAKIADRRGIDWALHDKQRGAVPLARPIRVECYADHLVILPEPGMPGGQVIPLGPRTESAVDGVVKAIWEHVEPWGMAGRHMYWKPILDFQVMPGGEWRYADFHKLLDSSGLTVQRRP